jgi:hypothetical protein
MPTQEIPLRKWTDFFESFSSRHEDWPMQIEVFDSENAQQFSSHRLRLKSISAEPATGSQKKVIVIVGEGDTTDISQLIRRPSRVLLTQDGMEKDEGLEIHSDNSILVMRFRSGVPALTSP